MSIPGYQVLRGGALWCVAVLLPLMAAVGNEPRIGAMIPWGNTDGYVPVVISIATPVDRTITFHATSGQHRATRQVQCNGGQTTLTTLLLPANGDSSPNAQVEWSADDGSSGEQYAYSSHNTRTVAVLLVGDEKTLPATPWNEAMAGLNWSQVAYLSSGTAVEREPVSSLPDVWQGYPTWMTLVIDAASQRALSDSQRLAIALWTNTGGDLVVTDSRQVAAWSQLGVRPHVASAEEPGSAMTALLTSKRDEANAPGSFAPLPGTERVPATGFMLLAVVFALFVGPINLWWVRRKNLRYLFLITTPILSLGTCALLLITDLILQGVSLRHHVEQLILLDQTTARATTWTVGTYYSGFALNSLDLDPDCEAVRLPDQEVDSYRYSRRYRSSTAGKRFTLNWGARQAASGTWGSARTNAGIRYREIRPERARIEVAEVDGNISLTNGLGADAKDLIVMAPDGRTWYLAQLATGANGIAVLDPGVKSNPDLDNGALSKVFGKAASRTAERVSDAWSIQAILSAPIQTAPGPQGAEAAPPVIRLIARIPAPGDRS